MDGGSKETLVEVEGAHCGACVTRIETALRAMPGVSEASFNLVTHRARIAHAAEAAPYEAIAGAIARAGYRARPFRDRQAEVKARRTALWRTGLAGFVMMQIMMFAYPVYVASEGTLDWDVERLFNIASLIITMPVLVFSAAPIWKAAWDGIRARQLGMDVPVALGIGAAFLASVPATFLGGPVYYESIAMFVFFLSAGRYFEAKALAETIASTEALADLLPDKAVRIQGEAREEVECAALEPGDRVWIAAGEGAPADCTVVTGSTEFNEALLTGESAPAAKRPGDAILAGSMNLSSPVEARVERSGEEQTLSLVRRLVERAAAEKPRWALLADKFAAYFVAAVLAIAVIGAGVWLFFDPRQALPVAIAVLVVSCPCALSLATPVALTAGANALARRGVLVTRGRAVEALASVTRVVFDKTGTLTSGRLRVLSVDTYGALSANECLGIANAVEQAMPHPIAHALVAAQVEAAKGFTDIRAVAGSGVEAVRDGIRYRVGSAAFCGEIAKAPAPFDLDDPNPHTALASDAGWLARFRFDDAPRPEAAELLARLRTQRIVASILSGDRASVVDRVARSLHVAEAVSAAKPEEKAEYLDRLAKAGETIAMVGDGVNDAPSLARAHVAIALGQGAALARSQADFVILNPSILVIAEAVDIARLTRRVIQQNLAWSAAYNALTLPLALVGVLTPWMASLGMSVSSLAVVANALRISRYKAPAPPSPGSTSSGPPAPGRSDPGSPAPGTPIPAPR